MNDKFEYNYNVPTQEEQAKIKKILAQYEEQSDTTSKIEYLKKLDFKVKMLPTIIGYFLGIIGILIFGLGLTFVLEWDAFIFGSVISFIGIIISLIAYPIYQKIFKKMKIKYSDKIIALSKELLEKSE